MNERKDKASNWNKRGKTVSELIKELQSFDDKELLVEISIDAGDKKFPISLVGKSEGRCVIMFVD